MAEPPQAHVTSLATKYKNLIPVLLTIDPGNRDIERPNINLVVCFDVSGSMSNKLIVCKNILNTICNVLSDCDTFTLFTFNRQTTLKFSRKMTPENKLYCKTVIDGIIATGGTNISDCILGDNLGLDKLRENSSSENILILITDGYANAGITQGSVLKSEIDTKMGGDDFEYSFHSLGIGTNHCAKFLSDISPDYNFINDPIEISEVIGCIFGG